MFGIRRIALDVETEIVTGGNGGRDMIELASNFRLGQTVCCIDWIKGRPKLLTGKVTRITKTTYGVADEKTSYGWFGNSASAFESEYKRFLSKYGMFAPAEENGWTVEKVLRAIFRLRRLQKRLKVVLP